MADVRNCKLPSPVMQLKPVGIYTRWALTHHGHLHTVGTYTQWALTTSSKAWNETEYKKTQGLCLDHGTKFLSVWRCTLDGTVKIAWLHTVG